MKDALGHGSNPRGAHASKLEQIGNLRLHPNVLRVIQKNPWGASVKPQTGKQPTSGFMVSVPGRTRYVEATELSGPKGEKIVRDYGRVNSDLLQNDNAHIGSWTDDATGKTHLDVSENIKNISEAYRAGKQRNQISIWDVARKRLINTGGSGDHA